MCGIAGFFSLSRRPGEPFQALNTMALRMFNRGPDAYGSWMGENSMVGLAHRRLSIIDLSEASDQPMHLKQRGLSIVFNGEIYNYAALRADLQQQGHVFKTQGDTEVLLHLYQQFGLDMVSHLRGMYAFVIWDAEQKTLVMARDPLGIKPLYHCTVDGVLYFASQVKSLQPMIPSNAPDPAGRAGFLLWGSLPEPYTFFRDIRSVPAGSVITIRSGEEPRVRRGQTVADLMAQAATQTIPTDAQERNEVLRTALKDTLSAHMTADVPVALFLSAGLDSATMAGLLSETDAQQPTALTLGFYGGNVEDETGPAAEIAHWYGLCHQQQHYGADDFAEMYESIVKAMDQPSIDGINTFMISRVAKYFGYKVALSGVGGDELFAGYPSFRQVPRIRQNLAWAGLFPGLGRATRVLGSPVVRRLTSPKYAGMLEYGPTLQGAYLLRRGLFMPWELKHVMDPALAEEGLHELEQHPPSALQLPGNLPPTMADRVGVHILEMSMYMRHQLLRDADWAGMANSVEVRVPFADWKLLTTLAPYIAQGAFTKQSMAATPLRALPDHIRNRPKTGFGVPVGEWIRGGIAGKKPQRGLRGWALHLQRVFSTDTGGGSPTIGL